jgi:hypothetical protein
MRFGVLGWLFLGLMAPFMASLTAQALEGLNIANAPLAVSQASPSVFMLFAKSQVGQESSVHVAAAFVVSHSVNNGISYIELLTAKHVIESFCQSDGRCPALQLYQNPRIEYRDYNYDFKNAGPYTMNPQLIAKSEKSDLALLRIPWSSKKPIHELRFVENLPRSSDKLYPIGFPIVYRRELPGSSVQPTLVTKRWSEGHLISLIKEERGFNFIRIKPGDSAPFLLGISADGMNGNSGGPVINDEGAAAGIVYATAAIAANRYAFTGSNGENENFHIAVIPAYVILEFLKTLRQN